MLERHERVLDLRAGVLRRDVRVVVAGGPRVRVSSTRLVSFTQRAVAAIRYEVEPLDEPHRRSSCSPSWSPTRQLPVVRGRSARRRGARRAAALEFYGRARRPGGARARDQAERAARSAAAMDHVRRRPRRAPTSSVEAYADVARLTVDRRRLEPGQPLRLVKFLAYGWSAPALAAGAARPGRRRAGGGRAHRLGRPARRAARVPRRLLGRRRRRDRGRRRAPAGGALRAVPHAAGRRARRAARDPGQGPDRPRLRRPHVLGHRDLRAAGAHLHAPPAPRPTRCAGAIARSTWRASARRSSASRAPRSRGARSAARSARATGPRAPPRSTSTPTSPTRWSATSAPPATRSSSARSASSCWSRPRGCGARSATTTRPGASASTASPGPTSTARSPTTTSTRT